jgi:hypothetical protein
MSSNYTFENFDNMIVNPSIISKYENYEIDSIIFWDFIIELIDILKVNIMLLAPFIVPLSIGYIIGKIYLDNNMYYENLENKIKDINRKIINCENLLFESKENYQLDLDEIGFVIDNKHSTIRKELESMKVHIAILNELVYSELENSNISRTKYYNK